MTYTVVRFDGKAWVEVGVYGDFETAEERGLDVASVSGRDLVGVV